MDDPHRHTVIPISPDHPPREIAPFRKPRPLTDKLAEEPLITAAVFVLLGAIAANMWAHRFGRTRSRLEQEALRNLNAAQRLDPFGEPLL